MEETTKQCSKCGIVKKIKEFYKTKKSSMGWSACKVCIDTSVREYRARKPKEWRIALAKRKNRKHITRYPQAIQARETLRRHVKFNKIIKPEHCQRCLQRFEKSQIHGHHEDYSKPLEVQWLCGRCHYAAHHPDFKVTT